MNQPKVFRTVWPVRAQFSVAAEESCRTLVSACREKSGVIMPESYGMDLIIKVITIMEASLS